MADDYNALQIQISASATSAIRNVNNLARALGRLQNALNSVNASNMFSVVSATNSLAQATQGLNGSTRAIRNTANAINNVGASGQAVQQTGQGLANVAQSASQVAQATQGMTQQNQAATQATQQLGNAAQNVSNNCQNIANTARNASRRLRDMGNSSTSASGNMKGLVKELTRISKMLKLMITRMVLRKVIQGVLDGFKNLAQYSSTFDATLSLLWNSFRQLGNSIAAAVSPLLNALAPALNYIIQLCIKAVNVINQLISALTGMSTWTRAKTLTDDYAKSLDKSNKSAKALKKTVLGFDELNQLQDNNSGGGGTTSPKDMFEEVPIDPRILKFIDDMKKKLAELGDVFKKGFFEGLGDDWKDKLNRIKTAIGSIRDSLVEIWSDSKVSQARDKYLNSFARMLGVVAGTIARIGLNIGVNLTEGIAQALINKKEEIKEYLVEMFDLGTTVNDQISEFSLAIGQISDVLTGENAVAATTGFVELFTESFMLITENAARVGASIVTLITQPIIDNKELISTNLDDMFGALATFADFAQGVVKDIRDTMSDVWEQHLNPMFSNITSGLSDLLNILLDAWHNNISPVLQELMDMLKPLWEQYIKPLYDDVAHILGLIGNLVSMLFANVLVPAFGALCDKWFPRIKDGLSILITVIKLVLQNASMIIEHITFLLRSFLQFFETGFTKGWGAACEELSAAWAQHWDDMFEKVRGIANSIVELIEKMINAIVHGLNYFGDKIGGMSDIQIPAWLGGGTFTFKGLAFHFSDVSLPRFASGGFPENGLFMANSTEMVGKFSNGKNAVANNEQITDGIAQAVYAAMVSANSGNSNGSVPIQTSIYIGEEEVARAVTRGQRKLDRRYSPVMA